MCGIFGFSRSNEATRLMTGPLALAMECRGHDSWGVTDGDFVHKEARAISEGFVELDLDAPIYHTRAASCGAVSDRNAHPFDFTGEAGRVVGIHNGHISNWQVLKDNYKRKEVQVDSEHIFLHLAEGKDVKDIHGWGAVAWYQTPKGGTKRLFLSKFGNNDNLSVMKLVDGTIVFASTASAINMAARFANIKVDKIYDIKENTQFEIADNKLYSVGTLDWGKERVTYTSNYSGSSGNNWRGSSLCAVPSCSKTVTADQLICTKCLEETLVEYGMKMVKA